MFKGGVRQSCPAFNHIHPRFHRRLAEFEDLVRMHTRNFGTAAGKNSHNSLSLFFFFSILLLFFGGEGKAKLEFLR